MHILFLTDNFPPEVNAAASRVYERACYWVKWGHKVTVITCTPNFPQGKVYPGYKNKWYQVEELNGIKVVRVKTFMAKNEGFFWRIIDFNSYMIMAIVVGVFQKEVDIIVATTPQFFAGVGGYFLSVLKRKSFILEVSDLWPASIAAVGAISKNSKIYKIIEKIELFLYRHSRKIIVLTQAFKVDLVTRGIVAEKVEVIINGVELENYFPRPKDSNTLTSLNLTNEFIVGYIGTHGMAHNLLNVLKVAKKIESLNKTIQFMFVGDGADRDNLIKFADKNKIKNARFISAQPKEKMPAYWSLCDIALIHLKDEKTFSTVIPSKLFEAMAMGLPIFLVAPKGEVSNLVERMQCGMFVEAGDLIAFEKKLLELFSSTSKLELMKKNSLESVKKFSREAQAKLFLEVVSQNIN
ncbi:MAG: glycosyltransferase WbuB [Gammaproteobacteria bacterium RIFCSPHIGHO2_12_FULL_35_23]|nr:MAG: glycosyltransferase WbuB [Gammaproteobacteria bacterium RIFCSPHIGHO2_12_FULL_35_23]